MNFSRQIAVILILILLLSCTGGENKTEKTPKNLCPELIKLDMKFLHGEDGSAWLVITQEKCLDTTEYRIREYYENGCKKHWDGVFTLTEKKTPDLFSTYEFIPLSTYESCKIKQNDHVYNFLFKEQFSDCK